MSANTSYAIAFLGCFFLVACQTSPRQEGTNDPSRQRADFYVAVNGLDAWSGQLPAPNPRGTDGPFATLARARDGVRQLK